MVLLLQGEEKAFVLQQGTDGQDSGPIICSQPETTTPPPPPPTTNLAPPTTSLAMSPSMVSVGLQLPAIIGICVGSAVVVLLLFLLLILLMVSGLEAS